MVGRVDGERGEARGKEAVDSTVDLDVEFTSFPVLSPEPSIALKILQSQALSDWAGAGLISCIYSKATLRKVIATTLKRPQEVRHLP